MALSDLLPEALRPTKPIAVDGPRSPRVSGVSDTAIPPVIEEVPGPVFAYRGQEQHGVPVTHGSEAPQDPHAAFMHTVDVENVHELHPPTPILVRVADKDGTEVHAFRTISSIADGSVRMIVNRMDNRTKLRIYNLGAVTVYIGSDSSTSAFNGFPLPANSAEPFALDSTESVYAVSEDGSVCDVRAFVEFVKG